MEILTAIVLTILKVIHILLLISQPTAILYGLIIGIGWGAIYIANKLTK